MRERVNVVGPDQAAMAALVRVPTLGVVRQTLRELPDGRWRVQAIAEAGELAALAADGFAVEALEVGADLAGGRPPAARVAG